VKQQDLGNIKITINNNIINTDELFSNNKQTICFNEPSSIKIDCDKKMFAPGDSRELGLYIESIKIISLNSRKTERWKNYSLYNVL
jgi:hypothetical protein